MSKKEDDGEVDDTNPKIDKNKTHTESVKTTDDSKSKDEEADAKPVKDKDDVENKERVDEAENPDKAKGMPKGVYFLLGNEFCERFSYYGMRTILTLYLTRELHYSDPVASQIYHIFTTLCYLTPVFGAILADSYLGRFWTIFYLSILYAFGNIILSIGAIPNKLNRMKVVSLIGIFIIGVGTGGIKPCVAAFGGDQFTGGQEETRKYFFSMFYFSINFGSLLSTVITPIIREDVKCFGQNTCYSLAFFVPAILFLTALILFVAGKPFYIIKPVEGSAFFSVFKCIGYALFKRITSKNKKKAHWIEYGDNKFDQDLIDDIKVLLNVLFILLPLPVFWALFEQQGSKWVLQASSMNGKVFEYHIKPDHMQLINPLLILIMIPAFDKIIYPLFAKCNICRKPLQIMTIGGFVSAISFVVASFIQMKLEMEIPTPPSKGFSDMTIINNSPCHIDIVSNFTTSLKRYESTIAKGNVLQKSVKWQFTPTNCSASSKVTEDLTPMTTFETMMITLENKDLRIDVGNDSRIKEKDGSPRVRLLFSTDFRFMSKYDSFLLQSKSEFRISPYNMTFPESVGETNYKAVDPSKYKLYLPSNGPNLHEETAIGEVNLKQGGSYIFYIFQSRSENQKELHEIITVSPNSVHILWQIPQLVIITASEVMFSITGIEFTYSQSPTSLKSIVQAALLLTNAIGNLLVVLVIEFIYFEKQSHLFLLFALLMALSMVIFAIMAYFYKYVEEKESSNLS